ncbi:MAG: GNAT family N-acetyltransferase [Clostridiales bacterium]|jgi:ribosomal protein S18 acetylase RimI-like enzyme|nr:GNAT family N-acetyltransferase [Clostridiales bacterium]
MLKIHLQEHSYPFTLAKQSGSIEFVATSPVYRRKGVAFSLIEHILQTCDYGEYVLEVADTNNAAMRLYEHLGFREFQRAPEKHPKRSGLNFYVYMKRSMKV